MGRKKKKEKDDEEKSGFLSSLKEETVEGVMAVIFILLAIFLFFASIGKAGIVGTKTYSLLTHIFGIGYFLIPVILLALGISFFKSLKKNLATPKIIGGILLLISGLGLLSLTLNKGGIAGSLIATPMTKFFDGILSFVFLSGILLISILVIFDVPLQIYAIRKFLDRNKEYDEDGNLIEKEKEKEIEEEEVEEIEEEEEEEDEEDEVPVKNNDPVSLVKKAAGGLIFFSRKSAAFDEFEPPPLSLLEKDSGKPGVGDVKANTNIIKRTLSNFGIQVEMDEVSIGPSVTRYALKPAEGVKLSKIVGLQNDLSLALAAHPIRIEAPIPGKSLVGIEIPNTTKTIVGLGSLLKAPNFKDSDKPLLTCLGKGITGLPHFSNMAKMPHSLIAGATGSGKSVTIHAMITSLLYRNPPENLKFIMVDPKRVELTLYNKIPHLLTPVITDAKKAILALKWAGKEMDRRYDILESNSVRDIQSYHETILKPAVEKAKKDSDIDSVPETMPYIVVVIDELADIMQAYPRELESAIVRLAQMSRAVGIHLMLSTQRPSVNVITGLIKANIPARIALQVASQIDSRTILDQQGAEKLLGAGDMLYLSGEMSKPIRLQSAYISEKEVKKVVKFLTDKYQDDVPETEIDIEGKNEPNSIFDALNGSSAGNNDDDDESDELYSEAKEIVISAGKASTSYLQRKLRVGYARAARLIDILEDKGIVGPAEGSKPREVLVNGDEDDEE
ncbi:MAG: S-DNA-T family DNA segregation ATPase FtsK/SpoIIIE [Candidatus Paceibacteria bacterium]|jgi:S-DNA-T family DNA segregation ATPase FtsK/SpoIIIE